MAAGERFTVGLGIDSSLRVARELVDKTETIQGGNRIVDFTYRLAMENFGSDQADVRLFDRLPQDKRSEIKLSLVDPGQELSEDPTYRQSDHGKGILRWDAQVPSGSVGPEAVTVQYKFRLEYDKQMTITGMPLASR